MALHGSFNRFHGRLGLSDNVRRRGKGRFLDRAGLGRGRFSDSRDGLRIKVEMAHPGHLPDAQVLRHL